MMNKMSILHIGFDDTDSSKAMCTTYLAYKIVKFLENEKVEFLDYPYLIRLNPNIPWKTRGNGAIALTIKTPNPKKIKNTIKQLVSKYSDIKGGANPGLVFFQNYKVPNNFVKFSELALWKLISRNYAKKFVSENNLETISFGNGQGIVGAIGAIGYKFRDHTFELLSYRKKSHIGQKREITKDSVRKMQEKTYPITFNSYDKKKDRILITPHGPDPVFYGLRGENAKSVIDASQMIATAEKLEGYMTFKTNQGTGDHLKHELETDDFKPYTSGTVTGTVLQKPTIEHGGHVVFSINKNGQEIRCAVYRPTKITMIAKELIAGDKIRMGGGVRKASKTHNRILNVETLEILKLEKDFHLVNPLCLNCNKRMKSKGQKQGFQCIKCGEKSANKSILEIPRKIKQQLYIPSVSAHRHLSRPIQRYGKVNKDSKIDSNLRWFHIYNN